MESLTLNTGKGNDTIFSSNGDDVSACGAGRNSITGDMGADRLLLQLADIDSDQSADLAISLTGLTLGVAGLVDYVESGEMLA